MTRGWLNDHLAWCGPCRAVAAEYDEQRLALRALRFDEPGPAARPVGADGGEDRDRAARRRRRDRAVGGPASSGTPRSSGRARRRARRRHASSRPRAAAARQHDQGRRARRHADRPRGGRDPGPEPRRRTGRSSSRASTSTSCVPVGRRHLRPAEHGSTSTTLGSLGSQGQLDAIVSPDRGQLVVVERGAKSSTVYVLPLKHAGSATTDARAWPPRPPQPPTPTEAATATPDETGSRDATEPAEHGVARRTETPVGGRVRLAGRLGERLARPGHERRAGDRRVRRDRRAGLGRADRHLDVERGPHDRARRQTPRRTRPPRPPSRRPASRSPPARRRDRDRERRRHRRARPPATRRTARASRSRPGPPTAPPAPTSTSGASATGRRKAVTADHDAQLAGWIGERLLVSRVVDGEPTHGDPRPRRRHRARRRRRRDVAPDASGPAASRPPGGTARSAAPTTARPGSPIAAS